MRRPASIFVAALLVAACGGSGGDAMPDGGVVEPPVDAGTEIPDASPPDATEDAAPDAMADAMPDATPDAGTGRGTIPADELVGTCQDACGGVASDDPNSCYCDTECEEYGDCCPDLGDECTGYLDPAVAAILDLPAEVFDYVPTLPALFQRDGVTELINDGDNAISNAGATLGRVLFHDPELSLDRTIRCASCHIPAFGFSDPNQLSQGVGVGITRRHSMGLINLRYYRTGRMFWDERSPNLEHQVLQPIQDGNEMAMELTDVIDRLNATDHYPVLFELAFGDADITVERLSLALAQFGRSIVSYQSKYDDGIKTHLDPLVDFDSFTDQENQGKLLFFSGFADGGGNCASCHLVNSRLLSDDQANLVIFQSDIALNIGLKLDTSDDEGRGEFTGVAAHEGKFKTPTLRNVALSAPYMHDGSLASLTDVVQHYNAGVVEHRNLATQLMFAGGVAQLGWSDDDVAAVVAFLETLTDTTLAADPRFGDPFLPVSPPDGGE